MLSFTGDGRQKQAASLTAHTGELLPTALATTILTSKVHSFFVSISFPITLQGNILGPGIAVSFGLEPSCCKRQTSTHFLPTVASGQLAIKKYEDICLLQQTSSNAAKTIRSTLADAVDPTTARKSF